MVIDSTFPQKEVTAGNMTYLEKLNSKLVSREKAAEIIADWRKEKCKIVFTNGCFDLVHKGHIDYLSKAADMGTQLIIGLNTDASISRIKGPSRPISNESSRALVMAAFEFVSLVVFFDEPTPYELIKIIQPDILVKGADYKPEDIVGGDIVIQSGGQVSTIEFLKGYSTSALVKRIIDNS
ncbi:MAG: D-glycero-beta-D-manno-heptose 1-phosphate adenylyltransferase [Bacteroidota bacterium]